MNGEHINGNEVNRHQSVLPVALPELYMTPQISPSALLSSSQQTLLFEQAGADRPSFNVFSISQQRTDLPLTLTTDAPAYFQLATDDSPRFLPELTLIPSTNSTYIHVRYLAAETGKHTGQLTITNGYHAIGVALTGQRLRRALVSPPRLLSDRRKFGRSGAVRVHRAWVLLLAVLVATGTAYAILSNQSVAPSQSAVSPAVPASVSEPKANSVSLAKALVTIPKKERTVMPIRRSKARTINAAEKNRYEAEYVQQPEPSGREGSTERVGTAVRHEVAESKKLTQVRSSEQTRESDGLPAPSADESELEHVLNRSH